MLGMGVAPRVHINYEIIHILGHIYCNDNFVDDALLVESFMLSLFVGA